MIAVTIAGEVEQVAESGKVDWVYKILDNLMNKGIIKDFWCGETHQRGDYAVFIFTVVS